MLNCTVENNVGMDEGAVTVKSNFSVVNSVFRNNTSNGNGAAFQANSLSIVHVQALNNSVHKFP